MATSWIFPASAYIAVLLHRFYTEDILISAVRLDFIFRTRTRAATGVAQRPEDNGRRVLVTLCHAHHDLRMQLPTRDCQSANGCRGTPGRLRPSHRVRSNHTARTSWGRWGSGSCGRCSACGAFSNELFQLLSLGIEQRDAQGSVLHGFSMVSYHTLHVQFCTVVTRAED